MQQEFKPVTNINKALNEGKQLYLQWTEHYMACNFICFDATSGILRNKIELKSYYKNHLNEEIEFSVKCSVPTKALFTLETRA